MESSCFMKGVCIMSQCSHCDGSGKCQDDFHLGTFSDDDNGPDLWDHIGGKCPSCGSTNTEMRPECPHCDGTGITGWL